MDDDIVIEPETCSVTRGVDEMRGNKTDTRR